jgi:hypothetical protein
VHYLTVVCLDFSRIIFNRPFESLSQPCTPSSPNTLGLHRVTVRRVAKNRLRIGPIEAIDRTPVIDIKPVLSDLQDF